MVVPTRSAALDEQMKEFLTELVQGLNAGLQNTITEINRNLQNNTTHINNMLVQQHYLSTELTRIRNGEGNGQRMPALNHGRMIRIDFLKFYGEDVRGWRLMTKR